MTWETAILGELIEKHGGLIQTGPFGSQLHESDYSTEGVPVVMPKDIIDGKISEDSTAKVREEIYQRLKRHSLNVGDIILPRRGDFNRRAVITEREKGWLCGTGCLKMSLSPAVVSPDYLFYYLSQKEVVEYIEGQAIGATLLNISASIVERFEIKLPLLPIQRRIAEVLGRYDALIENYHRQIGILEAMAQNLYREWFVRGRCPYAQASDFELKNLSEIAQVNLQTISEKDENAVINYVDISSVGTGRINEITTYALRDAPGRARRLVRHGDIVFSTVRPENRSYALILSPSSDLVFSTGFAVITPNQPFYSSFVYCFISTDAFITTIANKANGAAYPQVGFDDLMETELAIPSDEVLMEFHRMVEPIFQKAENLQAQIIRLRQMRDKLLPRLMSGQLPVTTDEPHPPPVFQ